MSAKALKYAEEVLGVHKDYEIACGQLESLDETLSDLDKAQDRRRQLEEDYADREVELVNEMRGVHPQMSDTRFKSEFKGWERVDTKLRELRIELNKVRSELQGIEIDAEMTRARIRVSCSRMEQLGGYLHYLAAVKTAAWKGSVAVEEVAPTQAEKTTEITGDTE